MLFMGVAALISTSFAIAVTSRAQLRENREVDRMLAQLVDTAGTIPFKQLSEGTFSPPEQCADNDFTGNASTSCTTVLGRAYVTKWSAVTQVNGGVAEVALQASTIDPQSNIEYTYQKSIRARGVASADGSETIRVRFQGDAGILTSLNVPIFLLAGRNFTDVADAAVPAGRSGIFFNVEPGVCTENTPCRVGLGVGQTRGFDENYVLDSETVTGGNVVISTAGTLTDIIINVSAWTSHHFTVVSEGNSSASEGVGARSFGIGGDPGNPPEAGSVCVWAKFDNQTGTQVIPMCNTADEGHTMILDKYAPNYNYILDDGDSSTVMPVPSGTEVQILSEASILGECPVIPEQRANYAGTWGAVSGSGICSSWTWGKPTQINAKSGTKVSTIDTDETIQLKATAGFYDIVWKNVQGRFAAPATGFADQDVWSAPRNAEQCPGFGSGFCAPSWLSTVNYTDFPTPEEDAGCVAETHCLSSTNAVPFLESVTTAATRRSWPHPVKAETDGGTVNFTTTVKDYNTAIPAQPFSVEVTDLPGTGVLSLCTPTCSPVSVGTTVTTIGTEEELTWQWAPGSALSSRYVDAFTLQLAQPGAESQQRIPIAVDLTRPLVLVAPLITSTQNPNSTGRYSFSEVQAITGEGNFAVTGVVGVVSNGSFAVSSSQINIDDGKARIGFNAQATVAGLTSLNIALLADDISVISPVVQTTQQIRVIQSAANFTELNAPDSEQGGAVSTRLTVVDAAGQPAAGKAVSLTLSKAGASATSIVADPPACVTTTAGQCTFILRYGTAAPAGDYELTGTSRSANATVSGTIKAIPVITGTSEPFTAAESGTLTLLMTDAAGTPFSDKQLNIQLPENFSSGSESLFTDSDGTATISDIKVDSSVSAGQYNIAVSNPITNTVTEVPIYVLPQAAKAILTPEGDLEVGAGGSTSLNVQVLDSSDQGVADSQLIIKYESGSKTVKVSSIVSTGFDGSAVLNVYGSQDANIEDRTTYSIFAADGVTQLGAFDVRVTS